MGHKCREKLSYSFLTSCEFLNMNCKVAKTNIPSQCETTFPVDYESKLCKWVKMTVLFEILQTRKEEQSWSGEG
jgi:hypothetical protein